MAEQTEKVVREDKIRIADEVIATIAGIATSEVDNVVSMSGNLGDGIAGMLGKKSFSKGIKVEVGEKEVTIELSIIVRYGCKIHHVAKQIQDRVRSVVEDMTGMNVVQVNVNVLGVHVNVDKRDQQDDEGEPIEQE